MFSKALIVLLGLLLSFQAIASGTAFINGKDIKSREQLHELFAKQLNFSHQYGKTIDSLYENLSQDFSSESIIKIKHVNLLKAKLGTEYINGLIQATMNAADENPHIILVLE